MMLYRIVEIFATVVDVLFLVWFVPKYLHISPWKKELRWTLFIPAILLAYQFLADRYLSGFNLLNVAGFFIISLGYAFFICQRKWFQAIFAVCCYVLVLMFSGSILYAAFSLFLSNPTAVMQGSDSVSRILYLGINKIIQFILFQVMVLIFRCHDNLDRKNGIFILLFSFSTAVGLGALMALSTSLQELEMQALIPIVVLLLILILANIAVCFMLYQVQKLQKEDYERRLFFEKIKEQGARADDAAVIWDNIRRVRHDLKNHFSVLRGLLEVGDSRSCLAYLEELSPTLHSMGSLIRSGNAVIDYLINTKLSSLGDTRVLISGYVGNYNDIADSDMAGILGNLLDNAVEALNEVPSGAQKSIELHFLTKNKNRIILCRNTAACPVPFENGELRSTKGEGDHGFGHKIVETLAKKYGGFVEYISEEQVFSVQVFLPMCNMQISEQK